MTCTGSQGFGTDGRSRGRDFKESQAPKNYWSGHSKTVPQNASFNNLFRKGSIFPRLVIIKSLPLWNCFFLFKVTQEKRRELELSDE